MKNKLTSEEQALNSKLNEADFAYQEADWAEMQQMMGKKGGFFSNYGTFLKAGAIMVGIVGSVALMNNFYPDEKQAVEVVQNTTEESKQEVIEEKSTITESEIEPKTENTVDDNNKEILVNTSTPKEVITSQPNEVQEQPESTAGKAIDGTEKTQPETNEQSEKSEIADKDEELPRIQLTDVEVDGAPCVNSEVKCYARSRGNLVDGISYEWFLDGKEIYGNQIENTISILNAGLHNITVKAYYNNKLLDVIEDEFEAEASVNLDFTYNDPTDPFYDKSASLVANNGNLESLKWYIKKGGKTMKGAEVTWDFEEKGSYEVTLQHNSPLGCVSTVTKTVTIKEDFVVTAPKHFTPKNGDRTNEVFKVDAFTLLDDVKFQMKIINLSGEVVFQTNDPNKGWNGRFNNAGPLQPSTAYAWSIEIENKSGKKEVYNGKVRILDL